VSLGEGRLGLWRVVFQAADYDRRWMLRFYSDRAIVLETGLETDSADFH
jgi:hypothetical protein